MRDEAAPGPPSSRWLRAGRSDELGPGGEGLVRRTLLTCPRHGWVYDLATGACLTEPWAYLRRFAVREEAGWVWIALLEAPLSSTVGSEAWNSRDLKSRPH